MLDLSEIHKIFSYMVQSRLLPRGYRNSRVWSDRFALFSLTLRSLGGLVAQFYSLFLFISFNYSGYAASRKYLHNVTTFFFLPTSRCFLVGKIKIKLRSRGQHFSSSKSIRSNFILLPKWLEIS